MKGTRDKRLKRLEAASGLDQKSSEMRRLYKLIEAIELEELRQIFLEHRPATTEAGRELIEMTNQKGRDWVCGAIAKEWGRLAHARSPLYGRFNAAMLFAFGIELPDPPGEVDQTK